MKIYFILFISFFLLSCVTKKQQSFIISCPEVFFSKDHRIYISTEESSITLNNISYKAEINNYKFTKECFKIDNKVIATLSILFVLKPENAIHAEIVMPYYIAVLDHEKKILDIQYFKVEGNLEKSANKNSYIETEIITVQEVIIPNQFTNELSLKKLLIGFMIDREKQKIFN